MRYVLICALGVLAACGGGDEPDAACQTTFVVTVTQNGGVPQQFTYTDGTLAQHMRDHYHENPGALVQGVKNECPIQPN